MPTNYLSKEQAEILAGKKLDHRRKYFLCDHGIGDGEVVCYDQKFLIACSGCCETGDYGELYCGGWDEKRKMVAGCGCRECGHTGVRRMSWPCPV